MVGIERHPRTSVRDRRAADRGRMKERATEIQCRLVVDGMCGEKTAARDVEEELLDELAQIEAALRTEELDVRGASG